MCTFVERAPSNHCIWKNGTTCCRQQWERCYRSFISPATGNFILKTESSIFRAVCWNFHHLNFPSHQDKKDDNDDKDFILVKCISPPEFEAAHFIVCVCGADKKIYLDKVQKIDDDDVVVSISLMSPEVSSNSKTQSLRWPTGRDEL